MNVGCSLAGQPLFMVPLISSYLISFPFPVREFSPSPFLNPQTQRSSCRGVCVRVIRITVACADMFFDVFGAESFFQRTGQKRLWQDRSLAFCPLLDGTSVDESRAPYLGLICKRTHCAHIVSHAHFIHPPTSASVSLSHTHSFLLLSPPITSANLHLPLRYLSRP